MLGSPSAMDSQLKSQELASLILSSSPCQIAACCSAIEDFFHKHTIDKTRSFFSIAFPTLIFKLFGFEDPTYKSSSSTGWIDYIQSSNDSDLAARVFKLLSPSGVILSSIHAVDRHFLVKFVFPVERLPEWTRFMLQSDRGCHILSDLCPLFKDRVKGDSMKDSFQVQLNIFEYYMFWFAYYPVCKGKGDDSESKQVRKDKRFGLKKWTSLPVLQGSNRGSVLKTECNLYNRLLYAYLRVFVPNYGLNMYQPYRSSLLHYSPNEDGSIALQAEFLVHTLIHFWLVDNDFLPLPVNLCRAFGVSVPFRAILDQCPPSAGLGEAAKIFVMYLNGSLFSHNVSFRGSVSTSVDVVKSRTMSSFIYGNSVESLNVLVQRPLYRFILRSFLFCPIGTSMKNASQVFQLWTSYLEPWKISLEDFAEFNVHGDQLNIPEVEKDLQKDTGKEKWQSNSLYTASWQGYVLSNYLFYSSLLVHFLVFAHKFLHVNADVIIQMTLKVVNILTSSKELMDLLKKVDAAYHSKPSGSSSHMFDSSYKFLPSIREQLLDWEDGISSFESDGGGLCLHEGDYDLKLFSAREDGGHQLLQLLILRAEPEIQALSGDKRAQNLQTLDSLRAKMKYLFGPAGLPRLVIPESRYVQHSREEVFTPKQPGAVKYKGDWMKRPITDGEVAWLARLLVRLSDWLNESLGLAPLQEEDHCRSRSHGLPGTSWSYVVVPGDEVVVPARFGRWVGLGVLKFMREHELRINLRFLASKVIVMLFLVCVIISLLKMAFGFIFRSPTHLAACISHPSSS